MGLEPILPAWKAGCLPLTDARIKIGQEGIRTPDTLKKYVSFQN